MQLMENLRESVEGLTTSARSKHKITVNGYKVVFQFFLTAHAKILQKILKF